MIKHRRRGVRPQSAALNAYERKFDLAKWCRTHLVVEEMNGSEWLCGCPRCGRSKLAVNVARKMFQCLYAGCGLKGWKPSRLIASAQGITVLEADRIIEATALGARMGPVEALTTDVEVGRIRPTWELPQAALPPVVWHLTGHHLAYTRSRGIPDTHAQWFGLGVVHGDGTGSKADRVLTGRVMFPVWAGDKLVFWVARTTRKESKAKVINMPRPCREPDHGPHCACYHDDWGLPAVPGAAGADEVVLGLHLVQAGQPVIVVEGPTDAAVCGPGFVATLGAHLSLAQAMAIADTGASEAIILYDNDHGGRTAAPKAAAVLSAAMPTRWTVCPGPDGTDPGNLGRAAAYAAAMAAPPPGGITPLASAPRPARQGAVKQVKPLIDKLV